MRIARWVASAVVVLSCVMVSACAFSQAREVGSKKVTAAAAAGPLSVRTSNGSVEVRQGLVAEMQVEAMFRAETKARLAEMDVVMEPDGMGGMKVSVKWPAGGKRASEGCSLKIVTPGASGIEIETGNGGVTLSGMSGEADVDTSNGSIEVTDHAGKVVADTSNGSVVVRGVQGDVRAKTSNGRIEAAGVGGAVYARTSNGSVGVRLTAENNSELDVRTSNGPVKVEVGVAYVGVVDADTSNGSVKVTGASSVEGSKTHAKAVFGTGAIRGTIKTSNGSVEVMKGS